MGRYTWKSLSALKDCWASLNEGADAFGGVSGIHHPLSDRWDRIDGRALSGLGEPAASLLGHLNP
jgi:hypothetical protein